MEKQQHDEEQAAHMATIDDNTPLSFRPAEPCDDEPPERRADSEAEEYALATPPPSTEAALDHQHKRRKLSHYAPPLPPEKGLFDMSP